VYEVEMVGIAPAVDIIYEMQLSGKIAILLDNQSAITSMTKRNYGAVVDGLTGHAW
jgi:hypothetical protein